MQNENANVHSVSVSPNPWGDHFAGGSTLSLNFMYTNADSLGNKSHELFAVMESEKPDIVCITETLPKHMSANYITPEFPGFKSYHSLTGRGVSIYVRDNIVCDSIKVTTDFVSNVWIKLTVLKSEVFLIGCVYRSPNSTLLNNEKLLSSFDSILSMKFDYLVIVGDFNYKEID